MPELPEVETVRAGLEAAIQGRRIARAKTHRADLRYAFPPRFAEQLTGRKIEAVERRAKYLLIRLSGGMTWLSHLGMSGRYRVLGGPEKPQKHDHLVLEFEGGGGLAYNDARRFGMMDICDSKELVKHAWLAVIGPEPLGKDFTPAVLWAALSARKTAVKLALLDQALVAGVGNIYACEALYLAKLHPAMPAYEVVSHAKALHSAVVKVLQEAIASGGSSLRDFFNADGAAGYFQHRFQVYGREGEACFTCATPIQRAVQGGRSTFFCSTCQSPHPTLSQRERELNIRAKKAS